MTKDQKYKVLYWAVILLALLNVSTIATILLNRDNTPPEDTIIIDPESSPLSGRYLRSELDFSNAQMDFYREESRDFRHKANDIIHRLNLYKQKLYEEIHNPTPSRSNTRLYSDSIGIAHSQLKQVTTDFYLRLKENCTPEQQQKLHEIFAPIFRDNPTMRGSGSGRGRRYGQPQQRSNPE
jgi:Spy/CpxP family protein refolding chaperone